MKFLKRLFFLILLILVGGFFLLHKKGIPTEKVKVLYGQAPSKYMDVSGMEIHYRDEGSGQPIVLLHGTAASLHTWDGWTEKLTPHFRVIRLDLPAFGITGPDPGRDYSIDRTISILDEFLEKLGVDSMILAGNSYGGRIALNYAHQRPEKVKKLILIDASTYRLEGDPELSLVFRLAQVPVLKSILPMISVKGFIEKSLKEVYYDDSRLTEDVINRYYTMSLRKGNRQAFVDRVNTDYASNPDWVPSISQPVLILWGEQDVWIRVEHAYKFEKELPNDTLIVYPDAGHIPMEEIPERSVADALYFLGIR